MFNLNKTFSIRMQISFFIIIGVFTNEHKQNCTMCFTLHETFKQINMPAFPLTPSQITAISTNDSTCIHLDWILGFVIAIIIRGCHPIPAYYRPLVKKLIKWFNLPWLHLLHVLYIRERQPYAMEWKACWGLMNYYIITFTLYLKMLSSVKGSR